MSLARRLSLGLLTLLLVASVGATAGYAWYLRSAAYRASCAQVLRERLGLPCDIGRITPRSASTREFRDVVIWLPERRDEALTCRSALVRQTPSSKEPDAYEIEIVGGECEISTRTWLRSDYRGLLESGLRPGFSRDGPRRLSFEDMDVRFEREQFRMELRGAAGRIDFLSRDLATATIFCRNFNGAEMSEPVLLTARFSPVEDGVQMDHLELVTPEAPLKVARLEALLGAPAESGTFRGRVRYAEHGGQRELLVSGVCRDLDLAEFTRPWFPRAWQGRCPEIELQELRAENGVPTRLRFRGALRNVALGDVLAAWGMESVGGSLDLSVGSAVLSTEGVERFVASGRCDDVSLEALSGAIGWGRMSGNFHATITDLTIDANHLRSLEASLLVDDAGEAPNWIEGGLLREVAQRVLSFSIPPILPARVPYSKLGARLDLQDEQLRVYGTHGAGENTILTLRLFGRDVPTVFEPKDKFDLKPWFDSLRAAAASRLNSPVSWRAGPPASAPAQTP